MGTLGVLSEWGETHHHRGRRLPWGRSCSEGEGLATVVEEGAVWGCTVSNAAARRAICARRGRMAEGCVPMRWGRVPRLVGERVVPLCSFYTYVAK